jgi:hypothetical protein
MKFLAKIFLLFLFISLQPCEIQAQQDDMFKQKKERKRMWRRWKPKREAYNPYVKAKAKKKPSARMAKGDKQEMRRQKKAAKKQMKRNKKVINS